MSSADVGAGPQATIRQILLDNAGLSVDVAALGADDDLYRAGLTSHASVSVMLACEDEFDVEFTAALLTKKTFASISSIAAALASLGVEENSL